VPWHNGTMASPSLEQRAADNNYEKKLNLTSACFC